MVAGNNGQGYSAVVDGRLVDAAPSATALWSTARAHLVTLFAALDDVEVVLREKTLLGLTGGPTADFNMCLVDDSPNLARILADSVARLRSRGLPGLFMISSKASRSLGARIGELGLSAVGEAPLMVFSGHVPEPPPGYDVVRVTEESGVHEVADMVATAFELDRDWVGRTFASHRLGKTDSSVAFYMATAANRSMSTVTVSGTGEIVGIWSMATPPDLQRRGAGKAALLGAMARSVEKGAHTFYLIATPAGKPLYDSVGFRTVETFPMYVPST